MHGWVKIKRVGDLLGELGVGALGGWRFGHASRRDVAAHCRCSQAGCGLHLGGLSLPGHREFASVSGE